MKYVRNMALVAMLSIFMCMLVSCANQSALNDGKKTKLEQLITSEVEEPAVLENIPETFQREDGNVVFDAEVKLNGYEKEKGLVTATTHLQKINKEKAFTLLWKEKNGEYIDESYESENEFGETIFKKSGSNADHTASLNIGPKSSQVSYKEMGLSYIMGAFHIEKRDEDYNAERYSLTNELDFMSREDAFSSLNFVLEQMGFDFENEYSAYALDAETMEKEEYHMGMDGDIATEEYKEQWTKDDDCYYFAIRQKYRGLPIHYAYCEVFTDYSVENAPVWAIFTKDGIMGLDVDCIYEMSSDKIVQQLTDFEKAAEVVSKKYNSILGDTTYTISHIELVYIVDVTKEKGNYELKPAWIFMGTQSDGTGIQTIIDAQTGNEVILWTRL